MLPWPLGKSWTRNSQINLSQKPQGGSRKRLAVKREGVLERGGDSKGVPTSAFMLIKKIQGKRETWGKNHRSSAGGILEEKKDEEGEGSRGISSGGRDQGVCKAREGTSRSRTAKELEDCAPGKARSRLGDVSWGFNLQEKGVRERRSGRRGINFVNRYLTSVS